MSIWRLFGPLRHRWRLSLGTRFAILVAGVLVVTMALSAVYNYRAQNRLFAEHFVAKAEVLGDFVATVAPEALLTYDYIALNDYMAQIGAQQDIVYAVVLAPRGNSLTSFLDQANAHIRNAYERMGEPRIIEVVGRLRQQPGIVIRQFPIKAGDKYLGTLEVGMDRARVDAAARSELLRQLLQNSLIIVVLAVCIYVVFRYKALRPIRALTGGARRMAEGDLEHQVPILHDDELGALTRSFNAMMAELHRNTREKDRALAQLQEFNKTLEARVEHRTEALRELNRQLEHTALHDNLTELPNRALVQDRLQQGLHIAGRERKPLSIVMMDLDRFKEINDTLGHHVGDRLLRDVGRRLRMAIRDADTVGRLGGDEFALVLPDTDTDGAVSIARKIIAALGPAFLLEGISFSVSASMGIATYPEHGADSAALLKSSDVAMYVAKHNKIDYFVYDAGVDTHSTSRLALMGELREALASDQLELHYQPIVALRDDALLGFEALIRWTHPVKGSIPPDEFVPQLEQTGLIRPFTLWVIEHALEQASRWRLHESGHSMAVNLSMRNLQDPDLIAQLRTLLACHEVPGRCLTLEITESAVMSDPDHVLKVLRALREMGVHITIDDFGTGYSSLSYLKRLPVQELKIDRSFVRDMVVDSEDAVIVRSIVDLAHNLGLKVIAEGVESHTIVELLKALRCDSAQGFHLGRPMPASDATELLAARIPASTYDKAAN